MKTKPGAAAIQLVQLPERQTQERSTGTSPFAEALAALTPTLRRRARLLTQREADADDLVQDTIERALVYGNTFQGGTNLMAWVTCIMRNLYVDDRRRSLTKSRMRGMLPDAEVEVEEAEEIGPIDLFKPEHLRMAMDELRPSDRHILRLAHFEWTSYREISRRTGLSPITVGTRLFRARARLRTVLFRRFAEWLAGSEAASSAEQSPSGSPTSIRQSDPAELGGEMLEGVRAVAGSVPVQRA